MGKRGPKRTPTTILKLRGSWRAQKRGQELKPAAGIPTCPRWLPQEARTEWRRIVPELQRMGLITLLDRAALAAYCVAWAEFRIATRALTAEGRTFTTKDGYHVPHPAVAQQRSAWQAVKAFSALFGLAPADRAGFAQPTAPEVDEFEKFMNGVSS